MRLAGMILVAVLVLAGTATADVVTLRNGDRLTGEIVSTDDVQLVLRTAYADALAIDRSDVLDIESDRDAATAFAAGLTGSATIAGPAVAAAGAKAGSAVEKEVAQTTWDGKLELGALYTNGNSDRLGGHVSATVIRDTPDDKFTAKALYNYAEEDGSKVTDEQILTLREDVKFDPWYVFGILEGEHDDIEMLDLRATFTLGAGRKLADGPKFKASLDLGGTLVYTDYETDDARYDFEARIGFHAEMPVFESAKLTQDLAVYPSITQGGEYRLVSETAFEQPLSEDWFFKLSVLNRYNSDVPDGVDENDLEVRLSLVYSF